MKTKILVTGPKKSGKNVVAKNVNVYSIDLDSRFWSSDANSVIYDFSILSNLFRSDVALFVGNCPDENRLITLAISCGLEVVGLKCETDPLYTGCTKYINNVPDCITYVKTKLTKVNRAQ